MLERDFLTFEQKDGKWICFYEPEGDQTEISLEKGINILLEKFDVKSVWKKDE